MDVIYDSDLLGDGVLGRVSPWKEEMEFGRPDAQTWLIIHEVMEAVASITQMEYSHEQLSIFACGVATFLQDLGIELDIEVKEENSE
jgi:hypothetical protein